MYTIEVKNKNRCSALQQGNESTSELHQHLISATNETARNLISKMSKKKKAKASDDPRVMDARKDLQKQCELYQQNPDGNQGEKLKASKEMLEKVYLDIADKELNEVIDEIVSSDNKQSQSKLETRKLAVPKKAGTAKLEGKDVKEKLGS